MGKGVVRQIFVRFLPIFPLADEQRRASNLVFFGQRFVLRLGNVDCSKNDSSTLQLIGKLRFHRFFGILFYRQTGSATLFAMEIQNLQF